MSEEPSPLPAYLSPTGSASSEPKRKYSRNGCTECKRRRMKCDEGKPSCWQCTRLNRSCVYILKQGNTKRKVGRKPRSVVSHSTPDVDSISSVSPADLMPLENIPNLISSQAVDSLDANLLIQNLNDMVNMKLNDLLTDDLSMDILNIPMYTSTVPISFLVNNPISFNMPLEAFELGDQHDHYLSVFYHDVLETIAPFSQGQQNPLRDVLLSFAKDEPYLLSAVLAVGASFCRDKTEESDKAYCAYLSHCLTLLSEQFANELNVQNKIEPIILTVLLLTWDCAHTMNSQWRSHLKGVVELFKKINAGDSSKVLNLCKCWFKVIETFATISTHEGSLEEIDIDAIFCGSSDPEYMDSLKYLNVVTKKDFNLLRGSKEDFDAVIAKVFKMMHREKYDYFEVQKILVAIDTQLEYEYISRTGVIPITSNDHPLNSKVKDYAIDIITLRNGATMALSWYDISHQTQVLSFLLIVLLKFVGMPKQSPAVQTVVNKIAMFFEYLLLCDNPPENRRSCYSNYAIFIAGLNTIEEHTKKIITKYYEVQPGNKILTEHNLKRLRAVWAGDAASDENVDVLTW